jgi:(p)ppGpp synthase/HD superfamily hydrolase
MDAIASQKLSATRDFAVKAHGTQKYGDKPYVHHLDDTVHQLVWIMGLKAFRFYDVVMVTQAAILHDVLEDTHVTGSQLREEFGEGVYELVNAVTDGKGSNRAQRKAEVYAKIHTTGVLAVAIKLADRLANVQNAVQTNNTGMLAMYRKEMPKFEQELDRYWQLEPAWDRLRFYLMEVA